MHVTRGVRSLADETGQATKTVSKALNALEATEVVRKVTRDSRFGATFEIARIFFDPGRGRALPNSSHPAN